jgi:hypothetical protein
VTFFQQIEFQLDGVSPYHVWYPLALVGVLLLGIMARAMSQFRRRYAELEMRRMASVDALGG